MCSYFLSADVHSCVVDGHVVFLDLKRDKYLCLDRESSAAAVELWSVSATTAHDGDVSSEPARRLHKVLAALMRDGLLTTQPAAGRPVAVLDSAVRQELRDVPCEVSTTMPARLDVLNFTCATVVAAAKLRILPIHRIVGASRLRRLAGGAVCERHHTRGMNQLSAVFSTLRPFFPRAYRCLFDSLALVEFLARYGFHPSWVFGVKMHPFAAHCWVQDGPTVLNDTAEHVRDFTPIMLV